MERKQRTIRTAQSCEGVGLHTGVKTKIIFHQISPYQSLTEYVNDVPSFFHPEKIS